MTRLWPLGGAGGGGGAAVRVSDGTVVLVVGAVGAVEGVRLHTGRAVRQAGVIMIIP